VSIEDQFLADAARERRTRAGWIEKVWESEDGTWLQITDPEGRWTLMRAGAGRQVLRDYGDAGR
jgi:hypothetical protein